jgi:predicted PurR-regulated permease PerM
MLYIWRTFYLGIIAILFGYLLKGLVECFNHSTFPGESPLSILGIVLITLIFILAISRIIKSWTKGKTNETPA